MDTLTHALIGALTARAVPLGERQGISADQRTLAGAASATFPDIDYLTFWIDALSFLGEWHRGPTHSLVLLPLWALLLGFVIARLLRRPAAWRSVSLVAALALLSHVLFDLITIYGTGVLYPLSNWRPGLGITFVIDPWLSGGVLLLIAIALLRPDPRLARIGLGVLAGAIAGHAVLQQRAVEIGREYAAQQGLATASVQAIAQPLSPWHWKVVVSDADGYRVAHVRLEAGRGMPNTWALLIGLAPLNNVYQPPDESEWRRISRFGGFHEAKQTLRDVWQHDLMARFRQFATLPAFYRHDRSPERECVWYTDLRFALPGLTPAFRYGLCRSSAADAWRLYRILRFSESDIAPV